MNRAITAVLSSILASALIGCATAQYGQDGSYGGGRLSAMGGMVAVSAANGQPVGAPQRGSGARRTYDAGQEDVHSAALYVMNRYTNGWTVQDYGSSIVATFQQAFVRMTQTLRFSPGLTSDSTEVEAISEGTMLSADARSKMENDMLNFISDAVAIRRNSAKRKSGDETQAEERPAPRPASEVDKIGRFTDKERQDDFAVVVGVEKYQNVPKADWAENDAKTVQKYFQAMGVPEENVILLTGQKATRTGLAKYLEEWLPRNATPKSRVYFYYSGHGAPDPADGSAYLVPWDGDPTFLKTSAYPVSRLYEKLGALKAREVVVMLDSCFSGAGGRSVIAKGARPLVNVTDTAVPERANLSVLSASSGEQISGAKEEEGHGLFTFYLLKGLKGAADPDETGHVTLDSLYAYVKKSVERAARRDNRDQTPQLHAANPALRLY